MSCLNPDRNFLMHRLVLSILLPLLAGPALAASGKTLAEAGLAASPSRNEITTEAAADDLEIPELPTRSMPSPPAVNAPAPATGSVERGPQLPLAHPALRE